MHFVRRQERKGYMMLNLKRAGCALVWLLISFAATGCGMMKPAATPAPDFCATAKPIYVSKTDEISDMTARAILTHNLTGRKLCGW